MKWGMDPFLVLKRTISSKSEWLGLSIFDPNIFGECCSKSKMSLNFQHCKRIIMIMSPISILMAKLA